MPENIVNYNFECYFFNDCKSREKLKIEKQEKPLKFEFVQIRLKIELNQNYSNIVIMVFCPSSELIIDTLLEK